MKGDIEIETISSSLNDYTIFQSSARRNSFYAEVKTRDAINLANEYYGDAIGLTHKHPQFVSLIVREYNSVLNVRNAIRSAVLIDILQFSKVCISTESYLGKMILLFGRIRIWFAVNGF